MYVCDMNISEQIKKHLAVRGWLLADLSRRSGVSIQTLSAVMSRKSKTMRNMDKVAGAFGITMDELMSPIVQPAQTRDTKRRTAQTDAPNFSALPIQRRKIPIISWSRAGVFDDMNDVLHPDDIEGWVDAGTDCGPKTFAIKVIGDSMYSPGQPRSIEDGSEALIDPSRKAQHGDVVFAKLPGATSATLRMLWFDGQTPYLRAVNERYAQAIAEHGTQIIGVVCEVLVRRKF